MYQQPALRVRGREFGYWRLKVADFAIGASGPALTNIREFEPSGPALYESHGFSPDGNTVLYSSNAGNVGALLQHNDIYELDLTTGVPRKLTQDGYNEHAHFSPDGKEILWMSNEGSSNKGTDLWTMVQDGSNKQRITYFNIPGCPEYTGARSYVADSSVSPDGKRIAAYVQTSLLRQEGKIVIIDLSAPSAPSP
jgi:Tol biopolymer transport system component